MPGLGSDGHRADASMRVHPCHLFDYRVPAYGHIYSEIRIESMLAVLQCACRPLTCNYACRPVLSATGWAASPRPTLATIRKGGGCRDAQVGKPKVNRGRVCCSFSFTYNSYVHFMRCLLQKKIVVSHCGWVDRCRNPRRTCARARPTCT
jgi:hypothetical protein